MTRDGLDQASRDELIEFAWSAHQSAEQEKQRSQALDARLQEVEQQLRWFKNQLFGAKSERRLIETDPSQLSLGETLVGNAEVEEKPATAVRSHSRKTPRDRKPKEEPGLRFDDTVPIETKVESNPEIEGLCEDEKDSSP